MDTSAAITLFLVMDPLGNVPVFLSVLAAVPEARRRYVLTRELCIAFVVMLAFLFAGRTIISSLGLRTESITLSGGIVLAIIAMRMIFPSHQKEQRGESEEPFIVPLAIPLLAGPSVLAIILLLDPSHVFDLAIAWAGASAILACAPLFLRFLGKAGLIAIERLMGMVLVALAVQMIVDGILKAFPR